MMMCFSPLPLIQSHTLTSGMEVSLSNLRLSILLGPGPCIPLSCAVKPFWGWLINSEQRQCCIGSPPQASSQNIKSFQPLEPLIWRHLNTRVIHTWLLLIQEIATKRTLKVRCTSWSKKNACTFISPVLLHVIWDCAIITWRDGWVGNGWNMPQS